MRIFPFRYFFNFLKINKENQKEGEQKQRLFFFLNIHIEQYSKRLYSNDNENVNNKIPQNNVFCHCGNE